MTFHLVYGIMIPMEKFGSKSEFSKEKKRAWAAAGALVVAASFGGFGRLESTEQKPAVETNFNQAGNEVETPKRSKATVSVPELPQTPKLSEAGPSDAPIQSNRTEFGHVIIADDPENHGYGSNLDVQNHPNQRMPEQPDAPRTPRQP